MKRAIEFLVLFSLCLAAGTIVGALARAETPGDTPPALLPAPSPPLYGYFPGSYADHVVPAPPPPLVRLCYDGAAMIAGMAGFAQVKLAIAAEQRRAWDRFVDQAIASLEPLQAHCPDIQGPPPADLPRLLERRQAILAAALDTMTRINVAFAALLPVLRADQRAQLAALALPGAMGFWYAP